MKYFLLVVLIPIAISLHSQNASTPSGGKVTNKGNSSASSGAGSGSTAKAPGNPIEKYGTKKWRFKLRMARQKMKEGSYYMAAAYLEDAFKDKPDKLDIPHLLAEANRYLRDYEQAEKYYKIVITKDPQAFVNDNYWLGVMQKMNGKCADAQKSFQSYLGMKLDKLDEDNKKMCKIEMIGCDSADAILKNPSKIKVEKTEGINHPLQDFAPKPLKGDRLIFSAQKTDTAVNTASDADYYTSIFTSEKTGKSYSQRQLMPYPPNIKNTNTCNAILSPDEKTMIYNICGDTFAKGNEVKCKLYRCTKKDDMHWNEPEELKSINADTGFTTTQPAWGVDEEGNNILYFVSDRKGTKGGLDIFYAKMNNDGTFGKVENAGDSINTIGNDVTPFYDYKTRTLYFSSTGHPSIGGYDVFRAAGTPGHWSRAINAGVPINSPADDMYFVMDAKDAGGFVVSNRVGTTSPRGATCCDDIWTVNIIHDIYLKATYVKRGDMSNTPVTGIDAAIYKVNGNNFDFVNSTKTTDQPFYFQLARGTSYKINGNKDGYWPAVDNLTVAADEESDTITKTFYIDPIIKIHIKIPNVYFAFDKSNIISFYKGQIDSVYQVLLDHPAYTLEIQGYTDSKGSDEYNMKLSERRAEEVRNFLVNYNQYVDKSKKKKDKTKAQKIDANRITAKWFGKSNPAVPNTLPDGEDDPEGRARNRRVEFKIIPDKPQDAPEFENTGEVVRQVKTGPGFDSRGRLIKSGAKKPAAKKK